MLFYTIGCIRVVLYAILYYGGLLQRLNFHWDLIFIIFTGDIFSENQVPLKYFTLKIVRNIVKSAKFKS